MKKYMISLLGFTENPAISIEEDKQKIVDLILYITNVLGVISVALAIIEYRMLGVPLSTYFYILFFAPFLSALIFRKKLSMRIISLLIVSSGYLIASYVMFNEGFYSGTLAIYITSIVIATILLGFREAMWLLGLCLFTTLLAGYMFTNSLLVINEGILYSFKTEVSWVVIIVTLLFLSVILSFSIYRIHRKLISSLNYAEQKTKEMHKTNEELSSMKNNLENLVQQRTMDIEEKNKRLILSNEELKTLNEELERLNDIFIGREFRIKELRDKVKELENRLGNGATPPNFPAR